MLNRREAILDGTRAAQRLHAALRTRTAVDRGELSHIDVFRPVMDMGAMLLFRPLKGLLGAYLTKPVVPIPGIIVSTQRDLHVQRFTAAHELGHLYMGHTLSLDEDQLGLWRGESKDLQEVAADAFASEFLLPRWLYVHHAAKHHWDRRSLQNPDIAYQLSLRLGASFDATCWGLEGHKILEKSDVDRLRKYQPKDLKLAALGGRATLANSWADVWVLTEEDNGLTFQGGPDDSVIFRCRERASSGYLWDETRLAQQGFEILSDEREDSNAHDCGGEVTRILVTRVNEPRMYQISMTERRPWCLGETLAKLSVSMDLQGREEGLPREARKTMAAA